MQRLNETASLQVCFPVVENVCLDRSPKWSAFLHVVQEIMKDFRESFENDEATITSGNVLIVASDERVCVELKKVNIT